MFFKHDFFFFFAVAYLGSITRVSRKFVIACVINSAADISLSTNDWFANMEKKRFTITIKAKQFKVIKFSERVRNNKERINWKKIFRERLRWILISWRKRRKNYLRIGCWTSHVYEVFISWVTLSSGKKCAGRVNLLNKYFAFVRK